MRRAEDHLLEQLLDHIEREAGRLSQPVAYLIILVISVAIWVPIGMLIMQAVGAPR